MFRVCRIKLPQKLDTIHVLGDSSSNVVVTIKADSTIRNGFRGLTVRSRYDDAIGGKSFLELRKEPRGRGETTDEPNGFDHASRKVTWFLMEETAASIEGSNRSATSSL
jgi:hypothetical protein